LGSLVDIAQRGRSLGLHLVLATQRPTGVVDAKIRANTNLRIALRLQDEIDSLDVIGTMAAARLPAIPGRGCVRAASCVRTFQTALVSGAPAREVPERSTAASPFTLAGRLASRRSPSGGEPSGTTFTDLERLVAAARAATERLGVPAPRIPWPPPLPADLNLADLPPASADAVALGLADLPDEQRQVPWWWNPAGGPLLVLGGTADDAASILTAATLSLVKEVAPEDLHVYAMVGGGGIVRSLSRIPHMGTLAGTDQPELLWRILEELTDAVAARSARGANAGRQPGLLIVIEDLGAVNEALESVDLGGPAQLAALLRNVGPRGVGLIASARHERGVVSSCLGCFEQRLVLRLADPAGYLLLGLRPREVGVLPARRAVTAPDGVQVQLAGAVAEDVEAAVQRADQRWRSSRGPHRAQPVRVLPGEVGLYELPAAQLGPRGWTIPVGLDRRMRPVALNLSPGAPALVVGPPGSGKSTTLLTVAATVRAALVGGGEVTAVASPGSPLNALEDVARLNVDDAEGLESTWLRHRHRAHLVVVDDAEQLSDPVAALITRIVTQRDEEVHLLMAARPETLRSPGHFSVAWRANRTGILMQPSPVDGDIFRTTLPARGLAGLLPGRGLVVNFGEPRMAQIARDLLLAAAARG